MFVNNEAASSLLAVAGACPDLVYKGSFSAVCSVSDSISDVESCSDFDEDLSVAGSVIDSSDGSVFDSSSDLYDSCSATFGFLSELYLISSCFPLRQLGKSLQLSLTHQQQTSVMKVSRFSGCW